MNKIITDILSDNSGGVSSTRLIMVMWMIALTAAWLATSFKNGKMMDIPESNLTLTAIVLGLKTIQRFGEKQETPPA